MTRRSDDLAIEEKVVAVFDICSSVFSWRFADTGESGGADCKLSCFGFHLLSVPLGNSF